MALECSLYLLVLHAGAFGAGGQLLHGAGVFAQGFVLLLADRAALIVEVLREQAVHHHVGVAADRRSEVRVVVEGQTVVADVVHGVACLLHGADGDADGDGLDEVLLLLALYVVQQVVDGFGYVGLRARCAQLVAEAGDELGQRVELLGVGQVVDAVGEYFGLLALGHAAYLLGHGTVGQQHELLDQLVGVLRHLEVDTDGFALLVYLELHLVAVEVDGSSGEAAFAQLL